MDNMEMNDLTVSILINNYNYDNYLQDCIDSAINQTYPNIEVILFDDASTDNSIKIASKYKEKIKIIQNKQNSKHKYNAYNQLNAIYQAFLESKGKIICLLDSDDMFSSQKIEKVVQSFQKNPSIVMVENSGYETDINGIKTKKIFCKEYENFIDIYKRYQHGNFHMQTSFLSFKREYLEKIFPIVLNKRFHLAWADYRLSVLAPYFGTIAFTDGFLVMYRIHGENEGACKINEKKQVFTYHHRQLFLNDFLKKSGQKVLKSYFSQVNKKYLLRVFAPTIFQFLVSLKSLLKRFRVFKIK